MKKFLDAEGDQPGNTRAISLQDRVAELEDRTIPEGRIKELENGSEKSEKKIDRLENILIDIAMGVGSVHTQEVKQILKKHKVIG